ncbi:MAG: DUF2961 domain-containing protein [Gemmatimonadales bacterium]
MTMRASVSTRTPTAVLAALTLLTACSSRPEPALDGPFDHLLIPGPGAFQHISSYDTTGGNRDRLEIAAGDTAVLLDVRGPGVIRRIWITVSSRDPHYLRRIALKMYWDDESTPSVLAPLGDFFGNGFDRRHYAALPMGVSSGGFFAYLPMPFRDRARIIAENGTGRNIDAFYFNIDLEKVEKLPAEVATFHAWWNRDRRTTRPEPHLVLDAHGRGYFAGMSLNAESHSGRLSFLEGDEIFTVDGEFRGQGTGTEDYFNGGWYFDQGAFAAPYHGVVVKDDSLARIAAYRWHIPDPISFHDSIRIELEHGHANQEVADYATMAYWYQVEPHADPPPLPPADERRTLAVKIPPGAAPAESLTVEPQPNGTRLTLQIPRADLYEVSVYPIGGPGRGHVVYQVEDGPPRTVALETEQKTVLPAVVIDTVAAGRSIGIGLTGQGDLLPAALLATPIQRWARAWHVVGPFPNPQRLGSEISPAIDSVYGPERDPDLTLGYPGIAGDTVRWRPATAGADGRVRLNGYFSPNDWVAAYAQAYLYAPDEREAILLLGADDAHVLWVNGQRVSERQGRNISVADDLEIPVRLHAGFNRVLLKVADLDGGWAFLVRAADPGGRLRWSAVPR